MLKKLDASSFDSRIVAIPKMAAKVSKLMAFFKVLNTILMLFAL